MDTYYQVDDRWAFFGVKSQEEYLNNYLVKGYFHSAAPTDVKESFVTVEYLLAHAYYYWPLYDEAFNKALRILEIAIKLKAKAVFINENIEKKSLNSLIDKLFDLEYYSSLKADVDRARKIRNTQMHPDRHSYFGAITLTRNIQLLVNIINQLFQSEKWHQQRYIKTQEVSKKLKEFDNKLLVIVFGMPLIKRIISFQVYENSLIIICEPIITNVVNKLSNYQLAKPLCYLFNDFIITESGISGTNDLGEQITIQPTQNQQNINTLEIFLMEMEKVSESDREIYEFQYKNEAPWLVVEQEYELNRINIIKKVQGI